MQYVDGYLIPVPNAKRDEYIALAKKSAEVFKDCGAISITECWGDDVPPGKLTSFPLAVKLEAEETVVFSWVAWPSREVRDAGMKQFMADTRLQPYEMPFDGKRMIFGGFQVVVNQ
jgi:uncharacterized protein YbaA (DUF1428 family)